MFKNGGLSLGDIAYITGGKLLLCNSRNIKGISIDTRTISKDDLFVAIKGERFDGHDYIDAALDAGAAAVIAERYDDSKPPRGSIILVDDTVRALGDIARRYREKNALKVAVAVTGSVGKTTTKQFIYSVLSKKYITHKSEGNKNNEIGLPLSVLAMPKQCEALAVELGMSAAGEIGRLARIAEPDIAVITNIGTSHIEHLGSREAIRNAKMEIIEGLKPGGTLILPGDEPLLAGIEDAVYVSLKNKDSDYYAENIRETDIGTGFDIITRDGRVGGAAIPVIGEHCVYDALCAFAVGRAAGLNDTEIKAGLAEFTNTGLRQNIRKYGGVTVIADCYNACAESMKAALTVLAATSTANGGRAVAVLGDMRELGEYSVQLHREVGEEAAKLYIDYLITVGDDASAIARGAANGGMSEKHISSFAGCNGAAFEAAGEKLREILSDGDTVLFKASRAVGLERLIEAVWKEK